MTLKGRNRYENSPTLACYEVCCANVKLAEEIYLLFIEFYLERESVSPNTQKEDKSWYIMRACIDSFILSLSRLLETQADEQDKRVFTLLSFKPFVEKSTQRLIDKAKGRFNSKGCVEMRNKIIAHSKEFTAQEQTQLLNSMDLKLVVEVFEIIQLSLHALIKINDNPRFKFKSEYNKQLSIMRSQLLRCKKSIYERL